MLEYMKINIFQFKQLTPKEKKEKKNNSHYKSYIYIIKK